jgi:O-antigen/teichoic acid export membrane protein
LASLKKNLFYNFLLSGSQVLLPLITIPYISRVLDPEGVGRVSFIDSFTYYFITIAEFGIMVYGMREVARQKNDPAALKKLLGELLSLHLLSSVFAMILYGISVWLIWYKIQDVRLLLFSFSFLLVNSFACEWYFLGLERFRFITFRSLITRILGIFSIFLLINGPEDYYVYYGIIAGVAILNSVWNNIILFREHPISLRRTNWRKHVPFISITYLISLVYSVPLLLDNVLLGLSTRSAAVVGFYAFAMKMVKTAGMLLTDALLVFFPRVVSYLKEKDYARLQETITRSVQLIIFFAVPVCSGLFLLSDELVRIFLGEAFMPAALDLRILAFFPFVRAYNLFLSKQILIPYDKEKLFLKSLLTGSAVFVVLTLILSSQYADKGACIAILVAESVTLLINYYYVKQTAVAIRVFDSKMLTHALFGALLFVPVVYLIRLKWQADWKILIFSLICCSIVYSMVLLYVVRNKFTAEIKAAVMKVLRRYH